MPRIEDRLLKAVIYMYASEDAAEKGKPGGSGFLVGEPNLAMSQTVPIEHPWGFTQPSFLVECRSVTGYSGSPVFIYRVQTTISAGFVAIGAERGKASLPRFLGIDWGNLDRVGHNDYAIDWDGPDAAPSFPRRSGMLVAVPAWRLAELLDLKEVQNVKRAQEENLAAETDGVNLDFEPSEFGP